MSLKQLNFVVATTKRLKINNLYVHRSDVFRYIEKCSERFDFIFADPPYQMPELDLLPNMIFANNLLSEEGIFILEHGKNSNFEQHENFIEHRHYGNVHFSLFQRK
jgi:16S rRNA G966 N2-methylase RsmD